MDLVLTISVGQKCLAVLLFTGVAAPIAGLLLRYVSGSWDSIGKGPFAIEQELPPGRPGAEPAPVDRAAQALEVRQMLEVKAERLRRSGGAPFDIEAEAARLLEGPNRPTGQDAELRIEVRQLVVARNERRLRQGMNPLDVETETERQLADFIGSS